MTTSILRGLRVVVLYSGVHWKRDEAGEIAELVAGLVEAGDVHERGVVVRVSDGTDVYRPVVPPGDHDGVELERVGAYRDLLEQPPDVVWVHMVIQPRILLAAARLRLAGVPVLLSPMSMLGADFASSSWFRETSALRAVTKPWLVRSLRAAWLSLRPVAVVASRNEAEQASLPTHECVLAPLPAPASPLARAILGRDPEPEDVLPRSGPVALVARFDVHRKGFDRLVRWLSAYRDVLPRPALLLMAPHDDAPPAGVRELVEAGTIEWDTTTRGPDVLPRLLTCRAMILLSRFEGMPRALREAALAGVPIVSTRAANWEEVTAALGTGIVVDGDDVASVQRAFEDVARMPRRAATARALFDRRRLGRFFLAMCEDLAGTATSVSRDYYFAHAQGTLND